MRAPSDPTDIPMTTIRWPGRSPWSDRNRRTSVTTDWDLEGVKNRQVRLLTLDA